MLKVFSQVLDEDISAGKPPPLRVLDSGCGTGVIGICAAAAIAPLVRDGGGFLVRCQDRDELARLITAYNASHNAARNGIPPSALEAHTEPLLAGPLGTEAPGAYWDLILTNIPAKAGTPVLEDFVRRSAGLLNPGGRVIIVAVAALADFFREQIGLAAKAELLREHKSPGHHVFVYGQAADQRQPAVPVNAGPDFITRHPFYIRTEVTCAIEDIPIHLTTIHGASGFDNPGGAVLAAAKLARRLGPEQFSLDGDAPLLIHEPDQGFFPCWLLAFLQTGAVVLSGRNILALEAARHNVIQNVIHNVIQNDTAAVVVPAADLQLGETALREAAGGRSYGCIAAFPELLPQSSLPKTTKGRQGTDQLGAIWDAIPPLLAEGGIFLAAFSSSDAERFDRKKPAGFSRLGSVKRNGFRALAYRRG